jgi:TatD DNase family protein
MQVGECGLDYDRYEYAEKDIQLAGFPFHFDLAEEFNLPMFLHERATGDDFYSTSAIDTSAGSHSGHLCPDIVKANLHRFSRGGVVHSFTGPKELMERFVQLGLYVGKSVECATECPL